MRRSRAELALALGLAALLAGAASDTTPGVLLGRIAFVGAFLYFCLRSRLSMPSRITLGIALGVVTGALPGSGVADLRFIGQLFVGLLKMLIAPMILLSIAVGIARLGTARALGRLGGRTLLLYVVTMAFAVVTGLFFANWIEPGAGGALRETPFFQGHVADASGVPAELDLGRFALEALQDVLRNPFASLAEAKILPIVFFALLLGLALLELGESARELVTALETGYRVVMKIIGWFLEIAPLGIFALVAHLVATVGLAELLSNLGAFAASVILATGLHAAVTLPLVARVLGGVGYLELFRGIQEALLVAFSTSSSAATLPVTTRCVEENLGVPQSVSSFVLPLGATVNMDGTALYEAMAALFIANVYGIELSLGSQLVVFFVAMLMAMGAPGIPSAGMVTMIVVLEAVGLPGEAVGILLAIDRFLDTFRTLANVEGDAVVATVVARLESRGPAPG